jgi:hypothetical protein
LYDPGAAATAVAVNKTSPGASFRSHTARFPYLDPKVWALVLDSEEVLRVLILQSSG